MSNMRDWIAKQAIEGDRRFITGQFPANRRHNSARSTAEATLK